MIDPDKAVTCKLQSQFIYILCYMGSMITYCINVAFKQELYTSTTATSNFCVGSSMGNNEDKVDYEEELGPKSFSIIGDI